MTRDLTDDLVEGSGTASQRGLPAILRRLEPTILEHVAGDPTPISFVGGSVIHDPTHEAALPHHAVVLGVGICGTDQLVEAIDRLENRSAAALVVRQPIEVTAEAKAALDRSGLVLLGLVRGVSWDEVDGLLRSLILAGNARPTLESDLDGLATGDLFSLADSICALIDAPITIEDREHRVLAYSARQDTVDPTRIETILGRKVPDDVVRIDEQRGHIRQLRAARRPVFIDLRPFGMPDSLPRVGLPIRAGEEILGTIWGVVSEPLSPEREEMLMQAAKLVAVQLIQQEHQFNPHEQLITDLLDTVVHGGKSAAAAAARLKLDTTPGVVVRVSEPESDLPRESDPTSLSRRLIQRRRLANALAVHLGALHPGTVTAILQGSIVAVVPVSGSPDSDRRLADECGRFIDRVCPSDRTVIGIGRVAVNVSLLPLSRRDADSTVRVLHRDGGSRRVAMAIDVEPEAWLMELRESIHRSGRGPTGGFARLRAYDEAKGTSMLQTLQAWLDAHGDVVAAAESSYIHQNTFRYRLKRVSEIAQIDLGDARERFHLALQMRIFGEGYDSARP